MESKKIDFAQYSHHSDIPNPKAFDMATYGVSPSQTPKMGYAQPMGFLLFKVDGWANIKEFPFRAFSSPLQFRTLWFSEEASRGLRSPYLDRNNGILASESLSG